MTAGVRTYLAGQALAIAVSTLREDGSAPAVASARYQVFDQDDVLKSDWIEALVLASGNEVTLNVPMAANTLSGSEKRGFRHARVELTLDDAAVEIRTLEYVIESESLLVLCENTFQTYGAAVLVGMDVPGLNDWSTATRAQRIGALIAAHRGLCSLCYRTPSGYSEETYHSTLDGSVPNDLSEVTLDQFNALDPRFVEAIKRAQVIEANELLKGDEIGELRTAGVMSLTIGESKQFFRPGKSVDGFVSRRALKEIHRWIDNTTRIGRS